MDQKNKRLEDYSLQNPPPDDHEDLGLWIWQLFEASYADKERLGLMDRWVSNYKLFRGNHWGEKKRKDKNKISVNLYFANVQRTVANITSKNPVAEVVDMDGHEDNADQVLSAKLRKWWHETEQQATLGTTCQNNEVYGLTIEKHGWSPAKKIPYVALTDPYTFFPAPNCPHDLQDAPYLIHAFAMDVGKIEEIFQVEGVEAEDVRTILGKEDREEVRPNATTMSRNSGVVHQQIRHTLGGEETRPGGSKGEGLVVECWFRDYSTVTEGKIQVNEDGTKSIVPETRQKYPDGIRVVTIVNRGRVILSDMENPNINLELPLEALKETYAWGRFPFSKVNSYEDATSMWGFSAAEQVGDLNKKIDEIVSRMAAYVNRALFPPMIIEKGCGITKNMVNNKPGLVLMPTRPNARIEFLPVPNLPQSFFQILDVFTSFHDRIYQIEDADRGVQPTGVTAASAIVALQERNAVLIQHKIRAIEYLARERGRWAISAFQNYGAVIEQIEVKGEAYELQGIALAGRKFNYLVESGSTVARTSIQQQEQAMALYRDQAIDRQALLETINFPNWKEVIERVGEGQLDQALQILVQAGLSDEQAMELKQYLLEPQTGPQAQQGQSAGQPQAGTPRAQQGAKAA
ncbi:MAG: hypothetical protein JEZ12_13130 [Desulfobacterium sp.]|nr:hypothetical protein [Desulfobacterium sp.]